MKTTSLPIGLLILFILSVNTVSAQTLDWLLGFGSSTNDIGYSIDTDQHGNMYVTGTFTGNTPFGMANLAVEGTNDQPDIFVAKFSAAGLFQWARRAGGAWNDQARSIVVTDDAVYISGSFIREINFNTPSYFRSNTLNSHLTRSDIFIAKYNLNGHFQWARRMGGGLTDAGNGLAVDGNTIYVTGAFNNTADFNTPADQSTNTIEEEPGGFDGFLAKFDTDGNFEWAKRMGGTGFDYGYGLEMERCMWQEVLIEPPILIHLRIIPVTRWFQEVHSMLI